MVLDKEMFTEEQLTEIQAEIDRERLRASETARKNAKKEWEKEMQARIAEALEEERAKLAMDEAQKLELERKKIEEEYKRIRAEKKSLEATKKLVNAGFPEEAVEQLLPMFVNLDDQRFEESVEAFISVNQTIIKSQVDKMKEDLLHNAAPPSVSSQAYIDKNTAVAEALKDGNAALAVEVLLGNTPA